MRIRGCVTSGIGKGAKYVKKYLDHFERILGITCHPGTLNIKVSRRPALAKKKKYEIKPIDRGQVDCFLVKINDSYDGAIVRPSETEHDDKILEVVAPVNLRERLHLKDGDEIVCELV